MTNYRKQGLKQKFGNASEALAELVAEGHCSLLGKKLLKDIGLLHICPELDTTFPGIYSIEGWRDDMMRDYV